MSSDKFTGFKMDKDYIWLIIGSLLFAFLVSTLVLFSGALIVIGYKHAINIYNMNFELGFFSDSFYNDNQRVILTVLVFQGIVISITCLLTVIHLIFKSGK